MQPAKNCTKEKERRASRILISAVLPPPPNNYRGPNDEALKALAISIRHLGLLQPITVRVVGPYCYELVSGERRLEACRQLGFTHIEAYVLPMAENHEALLLMMENLRLEGLHYLEEAESYASILESAGMTQEALAAHIGKSQSHIARRLGLLRLDATVREALWKSELSEGHARLLLRLTDAKQQREAVSQMLDMRLDIRESEAMIARIGGIEGCAQDVDACQTRSVKSLIRDQRLYVNAISDIIRQMSDAGMHADMEVSEEEDSIYIQVRMRKKKG
jgi:ParB family chromosome partitioning protein